VTRRGRLINIKEWAKVYGSCYDWKLRVKSIKKPYIRLIQENSIKFQVQSIYLIYTRLIVCAILNLAYPKEHIVWYYYSRTFYILLCDMWLCDHNCDI